MYGFFVLGVLDDSEIITEAFSRYHPTTISVDETDPNGAIAHRHGREQALESLDWTGRVPSVHPTTLGAVHGCTAN